MPKSVETPSGPARQLAEPRPRRDPGRRAEAGENYREMTAHELELETPQQGAVVAEALAAVLGGDGAGSL